MWYVKSKDTHANQVPQKDQISLRPRHYWIMLTISMGIYTHLHLSICMQAQAHAHTYAHTSLLVEIIEVTFFIAK